MGEEEGRAATCAEPVLTTYGKGAVFAIRTNVAKDKRSATYWKALDACMICEQGARTRTACAARFARRTRACAI